MWISLYLKWADVGYMQWRMATLDKSWPQEHGSINNLGGSLQIKISLHDLMIDI
jgi:hypothetical protein